MELTRRDFLRASSALAAAFGMQASGIVPPAEGAVTAGGLPVVWLQAQACTGCSVSLLNTIYYMSAADLLTNTLSVEYHSTLMAAAGDRAVAAAQAALNAKGYVLVVEGAIPTASQGKYCYVWPGMTAMAAVQQFAANAKFILAVGTCSSYGGIPAAAATPVNPTGVKPLSAIVGVTRTINLPGCPAHPDWIVGTVAYLLKNGAAPSLDSLRRPKSFYPGIIHEDCPYEDYYEDGRERGSYGPCRYGVGCKGPKTVCDCKKRKWNGAAANTPGVNWCMGAGTPCIGCTEPGFPDGMSPFYTHGSSTRTGSGSSGSGSTGSTRTQDDVARPAAVQAESTATSDELSPRQRSQQQKRRQYEQQKAARRKAYSQRKGGNED
jgi:hydrogenase small subunit